METTDSPYLRNPFISYCLIELAKDINQLKSTIFVRFLLTAHYSDRDGQISDAENILVSN